MGSTPGIVDNSNATAITIDSSENVGIGATSPGAKLEVADSDGGISVFINNTQSWSAANLSEFNNTALVINPRANGAQLRFSGSTGDVRIQSLTSDLSTAEDISLNPFGGNVGIGTSSSTAKLHVTVASAGIAQYVTNTGSAQAYTAWGNSDNPAWSQDFNTPGGLLVGIDSDETAVIYQGGNKAMRFGTNATERMRISAEGYVTTPQNPMFRGSYTGSAISTSGGIIPQNAYIQNRNMTHSGGNRITVPVAGVYLLVHHQLSDAVGTQTKIMVNGADLGSTRTQNISSNNESVTTAVPVILAASDYVEFVLNAGTIHGNPNYNTMSVTLIG